MKLCSLKQVKKTFSFTKPRIAVWCIVLLLCVGLSALVLSAPEKIQREYAKVECQEQNYAPYMLEPGSTLVQELKAQGQSTGEVSHLYLNVFRQEGSTGSVSVRIVREMGEEILAEIDCAFDEIPACTDLETTASDAHTIYRTRDSLRPAQSEMDRALVSPIMLGDGWFLLKSGEYYRVEITNNSESHPVCLLGNPDVQSGKLTLDGAQMEGFLNLSWMRKSLYTPSRMLLLMVLLTDATVLLGLALVLFTDVKVHVLYLVLAIGFGIVTLFDLTPLYGFDMRFQFDSAYVLSNQLMDIENAYVWEMEPKYPWTETVRYSRRYGDDYAQYQLYKGDEVSANYTDMEAGMRALKATDKEKELILVYADQNFISDQLYMYFPQAIGFTIARLLGLSMYPMLQLGRLMSYSVFVAVVYFSIRKIPFGKLIFLVSALLPTVLVQTVSLTRDAMIICTSFYITAMAIWMAYAEKPPKKSDWIKLATVSALLAPCKMIYLPVSCLFLLVIYRQYFAGNRSISKRFVRWFAVLAGLAVLAFLRLNLGVIVSVVFGGITSIYGSEAYTVGHFFTQPLEMLALFVNTFRMELGEYLIHSVQLFDIELGCNNGITLIVFGTLLLSACADEQPLRWREKVFMLLIVIAVLLLTAVAAMRWTPIDSNVIIGLQGRYLTPVIPLACIAFRGFNLLKGAENTPMVVKMSCCIFPALSLMNMYLWSIEL